LAIVTTEVGFYQGTKGPLFRIIRTPEHICAHMLFIAPLFEQANQTRHHITRSAINAYHQGIQSIVFDHFGTGDSGGELIDANLTLWQQDILKLLIGIKANSALKVYLYLPLSAVLLLSNEVLLQVDGIILIQPDFNGKRFVQQFKRLALVAELNPAGKSNNKKGNATQYLDIAGYQIQQVLLDEISGQSLTKLIDFTIDCHWFEWKVPSEELTPGRMKQQQAFFHKNNALAIHQVDDIKFWQATELQIAQSFLIDEKLAFTQLCSSKARQ